MKAKKTRGNMSLREFSRLCGVSIATVSRVFANKCNVTDKTKKHILDLADSMNFRPSPIAKSIFGGRTQIIGVLLQNLQVGYFADILTGIQQILFEKEYVPIVFESKGDYRKYLRRFSEYRVDAIIANMDTSSISKDDLVSFLRSDIPVIMVDSPNLSSFDSVGTDDYMGGRLAAEHLLRLGHREIAVFSGSQSPTYSPRLEGFRHKLKDQGLHIREGNIIRYEDNEEESLREALKKILQSRHPPSAIFAVSDYIARMIIYHARGLGVRVPEDLSVVGYADLEFVKWLTPSLTTIHQDGLEVGRQAAVMAVDRIKNASMPLQQNIIPVKLEERNSTCRRK